MDPQASAVIPSARRAPARRRGRRQRLQARHQQLRAGHQRPGVGLWGHDPQVTAAPARTEQTDGVSAVRPEVRLSRTTWLATGVQPGAADLVTVFTVTPVACPG